jgi:fatty acid desaturase
MESTGTKGADAGRWRNAFTQEELDELVEMNDLRSIGSLLTSWGLVAASFALVAVLPHPVTVLLALFVIGGRQLGFAVFMHEASHRTLLRNPRWNDGVGNWLCAFPIWSDLHPYRPYHMLHHAKTGTDEDPDLSLAAPFPITRASLRRKIWRDLSGQTGWKRARATLRRDLGWSQGRARRRTEAGVRSLRGVVLTNGILLAILTAFGYPALYLLWAGAWLTTYSLAMRIRSIAEHGMVPDPADPMRNTRTTRIRVWERLFLAPHGVNYHLEHHLLTTVPHYNLPRMHAMFRERGLIDESCQSDGYLEVLRLASSRT